MNRLGAFLVVCLPLTACSCSSDASRMDAELQGEWQETPSRGNGKSDYSILTFQRDTLVWKRVHTLDGQPLSATVLPYKVMLEPGASPKAITLTRSDRGGLDPRLGIYKVENDTLTMCFGVNQERPKTFNDLVVVMVLQRKKREPVDSEKD